ENSAGRLMQREVVMAPEHWTVGQAIDFMRANDDLPDQFYYVILVDPRLKPVAQVGLGKLMATRREVPLHDITDEELHLIPVDQDEEDVAYAFNQYHLISSPVTDADGRLVGVITIDDAMVVLDEEYEEDMLRLAGVSDESSISDSVAATSKRRLPWLAVNLCTAICASLVISQFAVAIDQLVALAILMPIVASMGGNAGTQSLTVAVRALATRDLTGSNVGRVIRRELLVGMLNGLCFAIVLGVVGMLWFDSPMLGVVIGTALVVNMIIAGFVGTVVPVVLDRLGADPALASGTFVTTTTDVMGFFIFLGLASVVLL
ncbi:magnesium transporter, partial [Ruegeria sp.]|uniref:magnesium transporter n=1 Tax=Ruegeria sp. TaxID=1879320 RepID=UPI00232808C0